MIRKITFFKDLGDTKNPKISSDMKAFERIRTGASKARVMRIRKELRDNGKSDAYAKLKNSSVCVLWSGTFSHRSDSSLINHSGLICLDFDDTDNAEEFKETLRNDKYIYAAFVSPSGTGVKAIVKVPPKKEFHRKYFFALAQHFKMESWDSTSQNESRICYESYDPEIYININSDVWTERYERREGTYETQTVDEIPIKDYKAIWDRLLKWQEGRSGTYQRGVKGQRHDWLMAMSTACNTFGIPRHQALSFLVEMAGQEHFDHISDEVKWAYNNTGDFNTKFFTDSEMTNKVRNMARGGTSINDAKKYLVDVEGVDENTAQKLVEKVDKQLKNKAESFWYRKENPKGESSIIFSRKKFVEWLQESPQNISRYHMSDERWELIRCVEGKRIKVIQQPDLKQIVFRHIENLDFHVDGTTRDAIWEMMAKNINEKFSKQLQEIIPPFMYNFQKDTTIEAHFYFQNTAVIVTKDGPKMVSYDEIENYIWENHVIDDHELKISKKCENDFKKFISLVCRGDETRTLSLESIIGYLLHNFKHKLLSKMVILYDETLSEDPNGGTGKGIFFQAISKMRDVVTIDGKTFDPNKDFVWQRVNPDTQLIILQDLGKKFNLEELFSIITDGINVNKKNKDAVYMQYEQSPKIAATSNYVVKGKGTSNERRKIEVEFAQHFNGNHTPFDEFKRVLFDDWSYTDWNAFYNYMIGCVTLYLKDGIIEPESINLSERLLLSNTSKIFYEWAACIPIDVEYDRSSLFRQFQHDKREDITGKLNSGTFYRWCRYLADHFGMVTIAPGEKSYRRSKNDFYWTFIDKNGSFEAWKKERGFSKNYESAKELLTKSEDNPWAGKIFEDDTPF